MLKKTLLSLLAHAAPALAAHPLGHLRYHQRATSPAYATCLTKSQGCVDTLELVQRCWETGVPSGVLDPNDNAVSENFRTCFCGDEKTTNEASWPSCAACVKNAGMPSVHPDTFNTDIVNFCATPDPNAYLFLTSLLTLTHLIDPAPPSPALTGPLTAISTLAAHYSPDPSANSIPDGIFHLTTQTVSTLPPPPPSSPSSSGNSNDNGNANANPPPTTTTTAPTNADADAVLTVLYYTNAATSMYVVGPASALASLITTTATAAAERETAITTGVFVAGGRTVLIVGPASTGAAAAAEGRSRLVDGNAQAVESAGERRVRVLGREEGGAGGWGAVVVGVVVGVGVFGGMGVV